MPRARSLGGDLDSQTLFRRAIRAGSNGRITVRSASVVIVAVSLLLWLGIFAILTHI